MEEHNSGQSSNRDNVRVSQTIHRPSGLGKRLKSVCQLIMYSEVCIMYLLDAMHRPVCSGHNGNKWCQPVWWGRQLTLHKEIECVSACREADCPGEEQE